MTKEQQDSLFAKVQTSFANRFSPEAPEAIEIVHVNATLDSNSFVAALEVSELAERHGAGIVTGVFPANVAVKLARLGWENGRNYLCFVPVAKPAPAKHGENRFFIHSHWEGI